MKPNQQADHPEEVLDIVDDHDVVVGTVTCKEAYQKGMKNFRVVHAFIKNAEGKLWIPRRVATKKLYPSALDFSVAGHVESGETYEQALIKETHEEVGIDLNVVPFTEIGYFNPYRDPISLFQKIYEIGYDAVPDFDPAEFSSYEWLTPKEVIARSEMGEDMKSDIPTVLELCYLR